MPVKHLIVTTIVLSVLLSACASSPQPTAVVTIQESAAPVEAAPSNAAPASRYLGCLSPALTMTDVRAAHTATLLADGRVLIAGGFHGEGTREIPIASAEIFDPRTSTFTPTGDMNETRTGHTATLLADGRVLIAGGWSQGQRSETAELYDPDRGEFLYTDSLMAPRDGMTATLLQNGQVLIAGGGSARNTLQGVAEIYDPSTQEFAPSGTLNIGRRVHSATLLNDGRVLIAGGDSGESILSSAEIFDPATGRFVMTGNANRVRYKHSAVLMKDGSVLLVGGSDASDWNGQYNSAEIFDPETNKFTQTADLRGRRFKLADAAVLLSDGNILIAGGHPQIEIFDAQNQSFIPGGKLDSAYYYTVATPLQNGHVLITGGYDRSIQPTDQAWLYCSG